MSQYNHWTKDLLDIAIAYSDLPVRYTDYGEIILPEEYLSAEGDWIGEFSRLISSHSGTARIGIELADNPGLACAICGWLCKCDEFLMGCPACGEIFFELDGELIAWEGEDGEG